MFVGGMLAAFAQKTNNSNNQQKGDNMKKTLVVYFSGHGFHGNDRQQSLTYTVRFMSK